MPELKEVFEMVTKQTEPNLDSWREQDQRQRKAVRNRRLGAIAVVAALVVALALVARNLLDQPDPNVGTAPPVVPKAQPPLGPQIIGLDGSTLYEIPTLLAERAPGPPEDVHWLTSSPDGTRVAFRTLSDGGYQVATMRIDGSDMRILTSGGYRNFDRYYRTGQISWSRDGSQIAFSEHDDIYVMDADGSNVRRVTTAPGGDYGPAWSPDGSTIVYWRGSPEEEGGGTLFTIPAEGGQPRSLGVHGLFPDWSATGWIAFDGNGGVWMVRPDGTEEEQITPEGGSPRWSPDGTKLSFQTLKFSPDGSYEQSPDGYPMLRVRVLDLGSRAITFVRASFTAEWDMPTWVSDDSLILDRYD